MQLKFWHYPAHTIPSQWLLLTARASWLSPAVRWHAILRSEIKEALAAPAHVVPLTPLITTVLDAPPSRADLLLCRTAQSKQRSQQHRAAAAAAAHDGAVGGGLSRCGDDVGGPCDHARRPSLAYRHARRVRTVGVDLVRIRVSARFAELSMRV